MAVREAPREGTQTQTFRKEIRGELERALSEFRAANDQYGTATKAVQSTFDQASRQQREATDRDRKSAAESLSSTERQLQQSLIRETAKIKSQDGAAREHLTRVNWMLPGLANLHAVSTPAADTPGDSPAAATILEDSVTHAQQLRGALEADKATYERGAATRKLTSIAQSILTLAGAAGIGFGITVGQVLPALLGFVVLAAAFGWAYVAFARRREWLPSLLPTYAQLVETVELCGRLAPLRIQEAEQRQKEQLAAARAANATELAQIAKRAEDGASAAQRQREQGLLAAETACQRAAADSRGRIDRCMEQTGFQSTPWESPDWESWKPMASTGTLARFGDIRTTGHDGELVLPAFVECPADKNFLIEATGAARTDAANLLQATVLRVLACTPPGRTHLTLIDPVGLSQNMAAFMKLGDSDKKLVNERVWTEANHIEQRLAELTQHMEDVIQGFLRNNYPTIEEYNAVAGELAQPYHLLVVVGFPVNFDERSARRLINIASAGPRCGIYTLVAVDMEQQMPHGIRLQDLEEISTVVRWEKDSFVWDDSVFRSYPLRLDSPPEKDRFNGILEVIGKKAEGLDDIQVGFERVAQDPQLTWEGKEMMTAIEQITVPIGVFEANKHQCLTLGVETVQHALLAGMTRSGKTNLLRVLITNLALAYSPKELQLYLVDFKKGVGFKSYAENMLPHARVVAIESEREYGLSVLKGLYDEMNRRGDLFRGANDGGANPEKLQEYREKHPEEDLPRLLLVVDEFHLFFSREEDWIAREANIVLEGLVRQGGAYGIHILLASQTISGHGLNKTTIDQMALRIAMRSSEADRKALLGDDNPGTKLNLRRGQAIINESNGAGANSPVFQVVWLDPAQQSEYLRKIRKFADDKGLMPSSPMRVFEGNAPAEPEHNSLLGAMLDGQEPTAPKRGIIAWLGDPLAVKDPTAAVFLRQASSNLLIVGQNFPAAAGMVTVSLASICAQEPRVTDAGVATPRVHVLDFSPADEPQADTLRTFTAALPGVIELGARNDLRTVIERIGAQVTERIERDTSQHDRLYLVIFGLQRARDLQRDENTGYRGRMSAYDDDDKEQEADLTELLSKILREGPDVGVHTIIWCDTLAHVYRCLDRQNLQEFDMRVALQMSAQDSQTLVESEQASLLGQHRAIFYSDEQNRLEKFRPYGVPSSLWLQYVTEVLGARAAGQFVP